MNSNPWHNNCIHCIQQDQECAMHLTNRLAKENELYINRYHGALEKIKVLEGRLDIAVETLEFYAGYKDDFTHFEIYMENYGFEGEYRKETIGRKARQALSKIKDTNE